jgi:hypothetical protein
MPILLFIDLVLIGAHWGFWGFFWTCFGAFFATLFFERVGCSISILVILIMGIAAASGIWAVILGIFSAIAVAVALID